MPRILTWLAATLIVLAAITYYQADYSGQAEHAHEPATAACDSSPPQPGQLAETEPPTHTVAPDDDTAIDPCANSEHAGKPGERK